MRQLLVNTWLRIKEGENKSTSVLKLKITSPLKKIGRVLINLCLDSVTVQPEEQQIQSVFPAQSFPSQWIPAISAVVRFLSLSMRGIQNLEISLKVFNISLRRGLLKINQ